MTKITRDMVQRFRRVYWQGFPPEDVKCDELSVRRGLEAALSPEPEIPVSRGMLEAAGEANDEYPITMATTAAIYRAMEKQRRKEAEKRPRPCDNSGARSHRRAGEGPTDGPPHLHRRKDD